MNPKVMNLTHLCVVHGQSRFLFAYFLV